MTMKTTGGGGVNTNNGSGVSQAPRKAAARQQDRGDLSILEIVQVVSIEAFRHQIDNLYQHLGDFVAQVCELPGEELTDPDGVLEEYHRLIGGIRAGLQAVMFKRLKAYVDGE
jgi:hypothetical protein